MIEGQEERRNEHSMAQYVMIMTAPGFGLVWVLSGPAIPLRTGIVDSSAIRLCGTSINVLSHLDIYL